MHVAFTHYKKALDKFKTSKSIEIFMVGNIADQLIFRSV